MYNIKYFVDQFAIYLAPRLRAEGEMYKLRSCKTKKHQVDKNLFKHQESWIYSPCKGNKNRKTKKE